MSESMVEQQVEHSKVRKHQKEDYVYQSLVEQRHTKPFFAKHFASQYQANEGGAIRMEAFVEPKNDPTIEVYFFKDDHIIEASDKVNILYNAGYISLSIQNVTLKNAGSYKCIARNQHGSCESNTCFKVQPATISSHGGAESVVSRQLDTRQHHQQQRVEASQPYAQPAPGMAPVFRIQLQIPPLLYSEGEDVYMEAFLEPVNDPNLVIEWYHNRSPLVMSNRHKADFNFGCLSLTIKSVTIEDSGEYTAVARNRFGQAESTATVAIIRMSEMVTETATAHRTFEQRETRTIMRQGDEFVEQQAPMKPRFLTPINNVQVQEGKTACLESYIEPVDDPDMQIDWFFEGRPLTVGNRFHPYYHFGYVVLKIFKVQIDDSGVYTCRITNKFGVDEISATIMVYEENEDFEERIVKVTRVHQARSEDVATLKPQQPKFKIPLKEVRVTEGDKVHLETYVEPNDDPDLSVEWLKNGRPLQKGSRFIEICDFGYVCLDILGTCAEDSGVYTVRAVNKYGEAVLSSRIECAATSNLDTRSQNEVSMQCIRRIETKRERTLEQEVPISEVPRFVAPLKQMSRIENECVHFETRLLPVGDENLTIEWLHNGLPLQPSSRISSIFNFGYVSLDIKDLKPSDSGTYTCHAKNLLGEAIISTTLDVASTATIIKDTAFPESLEKITAIESKVVRRIEFEDDTIGMCPPTFLTPLRGPNVVDEGMSAHFECMVQPTRDETMTVEWFHNNQPLAIGSRYRTFCDFGFIALDIFKLTPEDSGEYMVRVVNHLGTSESSIRLVVTGHGSIISTTVQPSSLDKIQQLERTHKKKRIEEEFIIIDKPKFGIPLRDIVLNEGDPLHLESSLTPSNDPSMRVEWYFNETLLKVGHRFKLLNDFGYVALDILYAYPEDSGLYECRATNDLGEAIIACNIRVLERQTIDTSTMHDQSLLRIRQIEQTRYVKHESTVFQTSKPKLVKLLPDHLELKEGQSVMLECILETANEEPMQVQWYHNGEPIKTGHRFVTINEFGYVALKILYVYQEDSGTYMVRVGNSAGEVISSTNIGVLGKQSIIYDTINPVGLEKIQILEKHHHHRPRREPDVSYGAPRFVSRLIGTTKLVEGDRAHLEARVEPINDPDMVVEILHNRQPLKTGSRFHPLCDFGYIALDVEAITPEDSGIYTIILRNQAGEISDSIELHVEPVKSIQTETMYAETLPKLTLLERGRFYTREEVEKRTSQRPVFTKALHNMENLREGENVHLECRLIPVGDAQLEVEWYKDGRPLQSSNRLNFTNDFGFVSLDIHKVEAKDSGTYLVKATNELGQSETSCFVQVIEEGTIITDTANIDSLQTIQYLEQPRVYRSDTNEQLMVERPRFAIALSGPKEVRENERVCLECRVQPMGDPSMTYTWYKNGKELTPSSRIATTNDFGYVLLEIAAAEADDTGLYMIRVVNNVGETVSSHSLKVITSSTIDTKCLYPEAYRDMRQRERVQVRKTTSEVVSYSGPLFVTPLRESVVVDERCDIVLDAKVVPCDDENLAIEWYKNGQPLVLGSRINTFLDFGHVSLCITKAQKEDSGVYMCRAANKHGQTTSTTAIKVNAAPNIDTTSIYPETLPALQQFDVSTQRTAAAAAAAVTPKPETIVPYFTRHVQNIETYENESVTMECTFEPRNDPNMRLTVLANGKEVRDKDKVLVTCDNGQVAIQIKKLRPEDSGLFNVKISNKAGTSMSTALLKVKSIEQATTYPKESELESPPSKHPSPTFIRPLAPKHELKKDQRQLTLECQVAPSDDPSLQIEWYHNSVKIVKQTTRVTFSNEKGYIRLTVKEVTTEDEGIYKCRAINESGECVTTTEVTVDKKVTTLVEESSLDLPSITPITPLVQETVETTNLHLEVFVNPAKDSTMTVEWQRNKTTLHPNHRVTTYHSSGDAILEVQNLTPQDSGTYTCIAKNSRGVSQQDFVVNIKPKEDKELAPQFYYAFKNIPNVKQGESIHMENVVTPKDDPNLRVEWFHDGRPLESSPRMQTIADSGYVVLEICHIEPGDCGEYTVVATNSAGVDSRTFKLQTVTPSPLAQSVPVARQAPKFAQKLPEKINLVEGQSVHLESVLHPIDDPTMSVEFLRNKKPLVASERIRTINEFGMTILEMTKVHPEDEGDYEIVARNDQGVDVIKTTIKCKPDDNIVTTSSLPIQTIEPEAAVVYTSEYEIEEIYGPPRFEKPLPDISNLREGESIHLETRIASSSYDPSLAIEWYKDDQPLRASNRVRTITEFGFVILEISPVTTEDTGVYTVRAVNNFGEAVLSSIIRCHGAGGGLQYETVPDSVGQQQLDVTKPQKPRFLDRFRDVNVRENEFVHLESRLVPIGDPTLKVEWYFNQEPFTTGSRFRTISEFGYVVLEILEAFARDSGTYECRASNQHGQDSIQCTLTVQKDKTIVLDTQLPIEYSENIRRLERRIAATPQRRPEQIEAAPMPPKFIGQIEPQIHRSEGEALHIDCKVVPEDDSDLTIEWYLNDAPLATGSRIHTINDFGVVVFDIDYLFDRDQGVYKCVAENKYGRDTIQFTLNVQPNSSIILDSQFQPNFAQVTEQRFSAPRFLVPLQPTLNVAEEGDIHFETKVEPIGDGEMSVNWYHNSQPLKLGHRHKTLYDFGYVSLDIISATEEDSGTYTCVAKSPRGEDRVQCNVNVVAKPKLVFTSQLPKEMSGAISKIAEIEAVPTAQEIIDIKPKNSPPVFVQNLEPLVVLEGDVARFSCRIIGFPKPRVMWLLNGETIVNGSKYKIRADGIHLLEIPRTKQTEGGKIEVYAKNVCGEAYSSATLEVRPRNADYRTILKHSPKSKCRKESKTNPN